MLSEQVASEIDREILRDLSKAWCMAIEMGLQRMEKSFFAANAYTQKDWNQTLITKS
jgi:hypothetical protein